MEICRELELGNEGVRQNKQQKICVIIDRNLSIKDMHQVREVNMSLLGGTSSFQR